MRRSVLFAATIALTLATAVGMFAAAMVLEPPPLPAPTTDGAEVVHRFYATINAVLRDGDPAALDDVVAPHFIVHGGLAAVAGDRAGLARYLVATSSVAPDLQLEIEEVAVANDRALVHLTETSGSSVAFLGVPFAIAPVFWGQFDALRIADGRVTELWSSKERAPLFETLGQSRLDPLLSPNHAMVFRRLSAEAGHPWTWASTYQSRVLYVEAGAIAVEVDQGSPAPAVIFTTGAGPGQRRLVQPGGRAQVQPGEALALSPVVRYHLDGEPSQPALRAYEVAFPRFTGISSSGAGSANSTIVGTPPPSNLPTRELLAEAAQTGLLHDALVASFGRITLPPGRALALGEAPGPVVLSVESGTLAIDQSQPDPSTVMTRLALGQALINLRGVETTLHAVGTEPVVIFAVTIVPVHAETRIGPSSHPLLSGI